MSCSKSSRCGPDLPERFAWAVPHDAAMWRLVPVPHAALGEDETMIDRWQTKGFEIGRYVWWEELEDVDMPGRDGWKTAILAVVNDRGIEMRDPPNIHCPCLLGHFVVYKRHYAIDGDGYDEDEDVYVPMSKEDVKSALEAYSVRRRERDIETRQTLVVFEAREEFERRRVEQSTIPSDFLERAREEAERAEER